MGLISACVVSRWILTRRANWRGVTSAILCVSNIIRPFCLSRLTRSPLLNTTLFRKGAGKMRILSLGGGVQSSTLALMAERGEFEKPDCAIFADTKAEPKSVYSWLDWLETQLSFPIHRVSPINLETESLRVRQSAKGNFYTKHSAPAFIDAAGAKGILMRQCTEGAKIEPIKRKIQELRKIRKVAIVEQWIGISTDEISRVKQARVGYLKNRWPLIERGMSRQDCFLWMEKNGFPKPPRSSCVFCPYHNDAEWMRLKTDEPAEFLRAVEYEKQLQSAMTRVTNFRGKPFLHSSRLPLEQVEFNPKSPQLDFFKNDCVGMCGH